MYSAVTSPVPQARTGFPSGKSACPGWLGLLLFWVLLPTQLVAPLLHAHVRGDIRAPASGAVHLPGLETALSAPDRESLAQAWLPAVVEAADLARREPMAPPTPALAKPQPGRVGATAVLLLRQGPAVGGTSLAARPPPTRAPPAAHLA